MPSYNDSESRRWGIENFPYEYLPNETVKIVERPEEDPIDLMGMNSDREITILIEVQVREQWGDIEYERWASNYYNKYPDCMQHFENGKWGLTVEQRKWLHHPKTGKVGHFKLDTHIPLIYVVLNNKLNRLIFATREAILSGRTVCRYAGRWGSENFKHTNDYIELSI